MAAALHHAYGSEALTDLVKHRNVALVRLSWGGIKAGHWVVPVEASELEREDCVISNYEGNHKSQVAKALGTQGNPMCSYWEHCYACWVCVCICT